MTASLRSLLGCFAMVLLLAAGDARAATAPEQKLQEAGRAYNRGEYAAVIRLLRPLLQPTIRLSSEKQVIRPYRLLGISYIFENNRGEAEKQIMAILSLQPDFRFDPMVDPVAAVDLLDELRRRNADKIKAIRERERLEIERRRREDEARRQREQRARQVPPSGLIERTVVKNPYWVNFVPLGAGQFQNGHRKKGYVLLGTELGLGAASLATGISAWALYASAPRAPSGKLKITLDEESRLRGLSITQVVTGSLCLATIVYGIIDAIVYHRPATVVERRLGAPAPRLTVAPLTWPSGAGAELGVSF